MTTPIAPLSTYRFQLGDGVGFAEVAQLVDYVADLGAGAVYLSPVLQARPGSTHGYDVADPTRVSAELGGEPGLRALADRAHAAGLQVVADVVPNHLGTGFATPLWRQLLADGPDGPAGRVFDVDFATSLPGAARKVVLPVLGDAYGVVLGRGELQVVQEDGERRLAYHDLRFPLVGAPNDDLHTQLEAQHYRLVSWRAPLVNYRRFFSIDDLAAVRIELPEVFALLSAKLLELVDDGVVDGLRIDHPDGLRDPARYLGRLGERTGGAWTVVEKITAPGEALRDWPVAGTTGYEFLHQVLGLFVDPAAEALLDMVDAEFAAPAHRYAAQVEQAKRQVLAGELAPDLRRIARLLWQVTAHHAEVRDVDDRDCETALTDIAVALDVYRTFVDPITGAATAEDVARVQAAVDLAAAAGSAPAGLYPFLGALLTGRAGSDPQSLDVVARVQQLTGALTAKGVEDTVFYRYRRLLAVNDVGGDPSRLGRTVGGFHAAAGARATAQPTGMTTTATHDTKRGEDARLRIAALSELPERWADDVRRWHAEFAPLVTHLPSGPAPDPQTELLLYQTLVAVWPLPAGPLDHVRGRVQAYAVKACREAKQRTSWRDPDDAFEAGVAAFLDRLFDDPRARHEIAALAGAAAEIAMVAGLAQVLLRCASPGVPDTYQGNELWDLSLVDPDNRRPVDWAGRRRLLAQLDGSDHARPADPAALLAARHDGRVKAWVLSRALRVRRDHPANFGATSGYQPLTAEGPLADHVVAFARSAADGRPPVVVVTPRLPGRVMEGRADPPLGVTWAGTSVTLPTSGPWKDALSGLRHVGTELDLMAGLAVLPVALLVPG